MMNQQNQQPDSKPGAYYVSVMRGAEYRLLLGPFIDDHAGALAMVAPVTAKAQELDVKACWYAFGTCRLDNDGVALLRSGSLNKFFNLQEIAS